MTDNMNKALADALAYGTGVMHGSDYVAYGDVYLGPRDAVIEEQAAEIKKLREALREIEAMTPVTCDMSVAHAMGDIASAALGETK